MATKPATPKSGTTKTKSGTKAAAPAARANAVVTKVAGANAVEGNALVFTVSLQMKNFVTETTIGRVAGGTATKTDWTTWTFTNGVTYINGKLLIPAGTKSFQARLATRNDRTAEANETITMSIGGKKATAIILNNDRAAATVTKVTGANAVEGNALVFTVSLQMKNVATEAAISMVAGTVTKTDWTGWTFTNKVTLVNGKLLIPAGTTSFKAMLATRNDATVETNETIALSIGGKKASATIVNNDVTQINSMYCSSGNAVEGEKLTFSVKLKTAYNSAFQVQLNWGGTAKLADLGLGQIAFSKPSNSACKGQVQLVNGVLMVPANCGSFNIIIPAKRDNIKEQTETVTVALGSLSATGSILSAPPAATIKSVTGHNANEGASLSWVVDVNPADSTTYANIGRVSGTAQAQDWAGWSFTMGVTMSKRGNGYVLNIPKGVKNFIASLGTKADTEVYELDETVTMNIGGKQAIATIINREALLIKSMLRETANPIDEVPYQRWLKWVRDGDGKFLQKIQIGPIVNGVGADWQKLIHSSGNGTTNTVWGFLTAPQYGMSAKIAAFRENRKNFLVADLVLINQVTVLNQIPTTWGTASHDILNAAQTYLGNLHSALQLYGANASRLVSNMADFVTTMDKDFHNRSVDDAFLKSFNDYHAGINTNINGVFEKVIEVLNSRPEEFKNAKINEQKQQLINTLLLIAGGLAFLGSTATIVGNTSLILGKMADKAKGVSEALRRVGMLNGQPIFTGASGDASSLFAIGALSYKKKFDERTEKIGLDAITLGKKFTDLQGDLNTNTKNMSDNYDKMQEAIRKFAYFVFSNQEDTSEFTRIRDHNSDRSLIKNKGDQPPADVVVGDLVQVDGYSFAFWKQWDEDVSTGGGRGGGTWVQRTNYDLYGVKASAVVPYIPPAATKKAPPIALDLTGAGLQFSSLADSAAQFDADSDGKKNTMAWVKDGTALLALDKQGDGVIDQTDEISFVGYKAGAKTDLEGLQAFDTNGDSQLDAKDKDWAKFGVWLDSNGDGTSQAGEFQSLDKIGIASVNLQSNHQSSSAANGDVTIHGTTTFTWKSGKTGAVGDVSLAYANALDPAEQARRLAQMKASMAGMAPASAASGLSISPPMQQGLQPMLA